MLYRVSKTQQPLLLTSRLRLLLHNPARVRVRVSVAGLRLQHSPRASGVVVPGSAQVWPFVLSDYAVGEGLRVWWSQRGTTQVGVGWRQSYCLYRKYTRKLGGDSGTIGKVWKCKDGGVGVGLAAWSGVFRCGQCEFDDLRWDWAVASER